MNYLITVTSPATADSPEQISTYVEHDSDMFHALCRSLEHSDRLDIKVTVELLKDNK